MKIGHHRAEVEKGKGHDGFIFKLLYRSESMDTSPFAERPGYTLFPSIFDRNDDENGGRELVSKIN